MPLPRFSCYLTYSCRMVTPHLNSISISVSRTMICSTSELMMAVSSVLMIVPSLMPRSKVSRITLSSVYPSTLFGVLCRAKKRKKYTSVFDRFRARKAKNRAPEKPIDRSEARICLILLFFRPKYTKKPLSSW